MSLLRGEVIKGDYDVKFTYTIFPKEEVTLKGKVYLTTFRLFFVPEDRAAAAGKPEKEDDKKKAEEKKDDKKKSEEEKDEKKKEKAEAEKKDEDEKKKEKEKKSEKDEKKEEDEEKEKKGEDENEKKKEKKEKKDKKDKKEKKKKAEKEEEEEEDEKGNELISHALWQIPMHGISSIEKPREKRDKKNKQLSAQLKVIINAKDMKTVTLIFLTESKRLSFVNDVSVIAFVLTDKLFAFSYKESFPENGYEVYDVHKEYARMGVDENNAKWRFTKANEKFELCDSYPQVLVVPAGADDELLNKVASFRTRHRLPVLTWVSRDGVPMMRSSQPGCGIRNTKSPQDMKYLELIRTSNLGDQSLLFISDSRPRANAFGNRALGGGFEDTGVYKNTRLDFEDIPNIHAVREGYQRIKAVCQPSADDSAWFGQLAASRWMDMARFIMKSTLKAIDFIANKKQAVLFHCSDGWDRTSQCCSLSELCMDPYYRTLKGFEVLIEKDWISFGHRFNLRYAHGDCKADDQRAPIFPQFIFCVYQLLEQFPFAFEFNTSLLECIMDNLYSCRFGTFLCDNERDRVKLEVRTKTVSLWSYVNAHKSDFTNPRYDAQFKDLLYPNPSLRVMHFWDSYFLSWQHLLESNTDPVVLCRRRIQQYLDQPSDDTTGSAAAAKSKGAEAPAAAAAAAAVEDADGSESTATGTELSVKGEKKKHRHHKHRHHKE